MNAAWTFWNTVSLGKMFVRWNERPTPRRQTSWGARPVMSRPSKRTAPASGRTCPVMRLKRVVLPAPFGPMIAVTWPAATVRLTPPTASKPPNALWRSRTSSTAEPPPCALPERDGRPGEAAGEAEQEDDEDRAQHERPVLGVGDDLLVEEDQGQRADAGAEEGPHPPEERHDQHLGGLGPVGEVGEDAPVEDAEEPAGEPREHAGEHEGRELVPADVDPDELGALRVLADRGEEASEGRAHDAPERPEAERDQRERQKVIVLGRPPAADERHHPTQALQPAEVRIRDLGHALLAARHLVPLEADRPHDLGERERQHREVDAREPYAEEAEEQGEGPGEHPGRREGEEEGHPGLLHEEPGGVGADPEVRGVAEGHEPGVAHEEVQAGGEERPDDDVVGDERVEARAQRRDAEGRHEHDGGSPARPAGHRSGRPRRPQGRTMRTAAMSANTAKIENRGKKRMPKDSTCP